MFTVNVTVKTASFYHASFTVNVKVKYASVSCTRFTVCGIVKTVLVWYTSFTVYGSVKTASLLHKFYNKCHSNKEETIDTWVLQLLLKLLQLRTQILQ
jgi:hypothetical protein